LLKKIDQPLFEDYWERLNQSLEFLSQKKQRTCIRLTLVKGENMCELANYANLIHKGDPDFIEVKGYMFVGSSRQRLTKKNMPFHEDIVAFSRALLKHLPDYDIVSEHIPSRVILLAKKKYYFNNQWHTWIDFEKFHNLALSGEEVMDYSKPTPQTGLSGKGTLTGIKVDEWTDELEFWEED